MAKALPLPCVSTASAAKTPPLTCVFTQLVQAGRALLLNAKDGPLATGSHLLLAATIAIFHASDPPAAVPGKDKGWADMTAGERRAAGSIGYHEASWDDGMTTETTGKWWVELSSKEQKAATKLGYAKGEWDVLRSEHRARLCYHPGRVACFGSHAAP